MLAELVKRKAVQGKMIRLFAIVEMRGSGESEATMIRDHSYYRTRDEADYGKSKLSTGSTPDIEERWAFEIPGEKSVLLLATPGRLPTGDAPEIKISEHNMEHVREERRQETIKRALQKLDPDERTALGFGS